MPQPPTLKISEIFSSIQGEGLRQGEPTLFIRLSGCNLKCAFCDTKYAWRTAQEMTVDAILDKIRTLRASLPSRWVCLTGGEPLLQDLEGLTNALKKENMLVQLETNATTYQDLEVDWYTLSPKPPDYFYRPEYLKKAHELKIVVTEELELVVIKKLRKDFQERIPILLQPQSNSRWSGEKAMKVLGQSLEEGLENVRVSVQIHKIFGWR